MARAEVEEVESDVVEVHTHPLAILSYKRRLRSPTIRQNLEDLCYDCSSLRKSTTCNKYQSEDATLAHLYKTHCLLGTGSKTQDLPMLNDDVGRRK